LQVDQALDDASAKPVSDDVAAIKSQASALGIQGTPSFAAGRTNGKLRPVQISTLDADGLRPALDSLLSRD
jgi:protein-disulfide isomerase-like protein with CxxC motif